ncbi:MAG TPA: gamma-glutamyl-gamma-aminobutyrate hydrolase family protein [Polyangiales bacterium]|nr:gamma-glutamyl-gamma-aminobutyrate hydrolase family protein [Polyangiales bacterium]
MRIALVSQRVDTFAERGERRDAVDQRLLDWVAWCDFLPVPVPNREDRVAALWALVHPALVVLSGGNDLAAYGGDAPERDETERALLTHAMRERVPLLGVCRGAQLILDTLGHELERVPGHVGARHSLRVDERDRTVNSYHSWGCKSRDTILHVLARSEDDVIEAFCHADMAMLGLMWHPERELAFHEHDRGLVQRYLLERTKP